MARAKQAMAAPIEVNRTALAEMLDITPQRVEQLVREGHIARVKRGRYQLPEAVRGYVRFLRRTIEGQTKSASSNRAQEARAREIEQRMAREDRRIVEISEAASVLDRVIGDFLQAVGGLPARITRDPRERQRIEAICDAERLRLSDRFAESAQALRSGLPADQADDEDDA